VSVKSAKEEYINMFHCFSWRGFINPIVESIRFSCPMGYNLFLSRSFMVSIVLSSFVNSFHVPALDLESDNRSSSYSLVNVVESIKIICAGISKFLGIGAAGHTDVNDIKNDGYNAKHLLLANGSASSHIIHTGL